MKIEGPREWLKKDSFIKALYIEGLTSYSHQPRTSYLLIKPSLEIDKFLTVDKSIPNQFVPREIMSSWNILKVHLYNHKISESLDIFDKRVKAWIMGFWYCSS